MPGRAAPPGSCPVHYHTEVGPAVLLLPVRDRVGHGVLRLPTPRRLCVIISVKGLPNLCDKFAQYGVSG